MLAHSGASKNCFGGTYKVLAYACRPAADAGTAEDEDVIQVLDPLDRVQLCRGEPQEARQMPLALRQVFVPPPLEDSMTPTL
jgi:hypothetical protein